MVGTDFSATGRRHVCAMRTGSVTRVPSKSIASTPMTSLEAGRWIQSEKRFFRPRINQPFLRINVGPAVRSATIVADKTFNLKNDRRHFRTDTHASYPRRLLFITSGYFQASGLVSSDYSHVFSSRPCFWETEVGWGLVVLSVLAIFGYVLMRVFIFDLVDEMYFDGNEFLVKNQGRECRIGLSRA